MYVHDDKLLYTNNLPLLSQIQVQMSLLDDSYFHA
jgi:hypothetical protein